MIAIISPAKTLDYDSETPPHDPSEMRFASEAQELIAVLRKKTRSQLRELMSISENLADLNYERYHDWSLPFSEDNARSAILAFQGDVYTGIDSEHYSNPDFTFLQKHVRILSGLYGLLRPLDLIQPYRLEMGTKLQTKLGETLYEYWGSRITDQLRADLGDSGSDVLINLASKEYYSSIQPKDLSSRIITPNFKDKKGDSYRIVSFYAKKARGSMVDFIVENRSEDPESLKDFKRDGYAFNQKLSSGDDWIFTRDEVPTA